MAAVTLIYRDFLRGVRFSFYYYRDLAFRSLLYIIRRYLSSTTHRSELIVLS